MYRVYKTTLPSNFQYNKYVLIGEWTNYDSSINSAETTYGHYRKSEKQVPLP